MRLSYPKQIKEGHLKMCSFDEEILAFDNLAISDIPGTAAANSEVVEQNHALVCGSSWKQSDTDYQSDSLIDI